MLVDGVNIIEPRAHDLISKSVDILGKVPVSLSVGVLFRPVSQKSATIKWIEKTNAYTSRDGGRHNNLIAPSLSLLSTRSCSINTLHGSRQQPPSRAFHSERGDGSRVKAGVECHIEDHLASLRAVILGEMASVSVGLYLLTESFNSKVELGGNRGDDVCDLLLEFGDG